MGNFIGGLVDFFYVVNGVTHGKTSISYGKYTPKLYDIIRYDLLEWPGKHFGMISEILGNDMKIFNLVLKTNDGKKNNGCEFEMKHQSFKDFIKDKKKYQIGTFKNLNDKNSEEIIIKKIKEKENKSETYDFIINNCDKQVCEILIKNYFGNGEQIQNILDITKKKYDDKTTKNDVTDNSGHFNWVEYDVI